VVRRNQGHGQLSSLNPANRQAIGATGPGSPAHPAAHEGQDRRERKRSERVPRRDLLVTDLDRSFIDDLSMPTFGGGKHGRTLRAYHGFWPAIPLRLGSLGGDERPREEAELGIPGKTVVRRCR
jgi:hypothetical protein